MTVGTVVCRSKRSWGTTHTDSRMIENVHSMSEKDVRCLVARLITMTTGVKTIDPPRQYAPSLHDFSRSLVRGYSLIISAII